MLYTEAGRAHLRSRAMYAMLTRDEFSAWLVGATLPSNVSVNPLVRKWIPGGGMAFYICIIDHHTSYGGISIEYFRHPIEAIEHIHNYAMWS